MYTITYEGGAEDFDGLDEAVHRAADLGIAGIVVYSLQGPEGFFALDIVDEVMYRKLDVADPNVDETIPREDHHACPAPAPRPISDGGPA